ncbi:hypothetical protein [Morganella morganii]|uniref:hypothetical protein n=1 Tax=Morganella morganii TaxID=582 RepID=UPI0011648D04
MKKTATFFMVQARALPVPYNHLYAFKTDKCSGGNIAKIIWYGDGIIDNQLNWIKPSEINNYHDSIIQKIAERFESKKALTELITMMIDEEKQYAKN